MADIFNEIDEDLRRDRANRLWQKYGVLVLALAVLIVLAVAGWRGWEWYRQQQAEQAGGRFEDALSFVRTGDAKQATATLDGLAKDGPAGYRTLARFRLAAEAGKADPQAGIKAYEELAGDGALGAELRELARVRSGYLAVDVTPYAELLAKIEPMTVGTQPWRHAAREVLGLAAWKAKDLTAATKWFEAVISDAGAPGGTRQRAELMLELIASDAPPKAAS